MWQILGTGLLLLLPAVPVTAATKSTTFTTTATITGGCIFGSGPVAGSTNAGTINFGTLADLRNAVNMTSTAGAGSVVVTCTPGLSVSVALDYGLNGGSASARYMKSSAGGTIAYQLYQNATRTTVWGTGALARTVASFPVTTQTWPVYAQLVATGTSPAAGTYTDTVTVTLTY